MQTYVEEFKKCRGLAGLFAHLFSHVDKHWCEQMLDEGMPGVYQIRDLHLRSWKEEVVIRGWGAAQKSVSVEDEFGSLLDVAVRLRERDDRIAGGDGDRALLELTDEVFRSFDEVGVVVVGTWVAERAREAGLLHVVDPRAVRREILSSGLEIVHLV